MVATGAVSTTSTYEAANAYISMGLRVFPVYQMASPGVCSCNRGASCTNQGKHPILPGGWHIATKMQTTVDYWWKGKTTNIGLCAPLSMLIAVDVDNKPDGKGFESFEKLVRLCGSWPVTAKAKTGSGGYHYLFAMPQEIVDALPFRAVPDGDPKKDMSVHIIGFMPGIDIVNYIVVQPSANAKGAYVWEVEPQPEHIAVLPLYLQEEIISCIRMKEANPLQADIEALPEVITEGTRNDALFSHAGLFRRRGFDFGGIYPAIADYNRKHCQPPLDDREVRNLVQSVLRYAPSDVPWQRPPTTTETLASGVVVEHRVLWPEEMISRSKPLFAIDTILVVESLAALTGYEGTFKSFIALSMGLALSLGEDWYGLKTTQMPVCYISAEGAAGMGARINAWQIHHGLVALEGEFGTIDHAVQLADPNAVDGLIRSITAQFKTAPRLIIADTLARCFVGHDENAAESMGRLIDAFERLKREFNAIIMPIHHNAKTGGIRGSSALIGALDTNLTTERDGDIVVLRGAKQKEYAPFEPLYLKQHIIDLPNGETSLVFDKIEKNAAISGRDSTQAALQCLQILSLANEGGVSATEWLASYKAATKHGDHLFYETTKTLMEDGSVVREKKGKTVTYIPNC